MNREKFIIFVESIGFVFEKDRLYSYIYKEFRIYLYSKNHYNIFNGYKWEKCSYDYLAPELLKLSR